MGAPCSTAHGPAAAVRTDMLTPTDTESALIRCKAGFHPRASPSTRGRKEAEKNQTDDAHLGGLEVRAGDGLNLPALPRAALLKVWSLTSSTGTTWNVSEMCPRPS